MMIIFRREEAAESNPFVTDIIFGGAAYVDLLIFLTPRPRAYQLNLGSATDMHKGSQLCLGDQRQLQLLKHVVSALNFLFCLVTLDLF